KEECAGTTQLKGKSPSGGSVFQLWKQELYPVFSTPGKSPLKRWQPANSPYVHLVPDQKMASTGGSSAWSESSAVPASENMVYLKSITLYEQLHPGPFRDKSSISRGASSASRSWISSGSGGFWPGSFEQERERRNSHAATKS